MSPRRAPATGRRWQFSEMASPPQHLRQEQVKAPHSHHHSKNQTPTPADPRSPRLTPPLCQHLTAGPHALPRPPSRSLLHVKDPRSRFPVLHIKATLSPLDLQLRGELQTNSHAPLLPCRN